MENVLFDIKPLGKRFPKLDGSSSKAYCQVTSSCKQKESRKDDHARVQRLADVTLVNSEQKHVETVYRVSDSVLSSESRVFHEIISSHISWRLFKDVVSTEQVQ